MPCIGTFMMEDKKQFLTSQEIRDIQRAVEAKSSTIAELSLQHIDERWVWHETWSRETGGMWSKNRWIDESPKGHETDYADLEERHLVQIKDLSVNALLQLLLDIAKYEGS